MKHGTLGLVVAALFCSGCASTPPDEVREPSFAEWAAGGLFVMVLELALQDSALGERRDELEPNEQEECRKRMNCYTAEQRERSQQRDRKRAADAKKTAEERERARELDQSLQAWFEEEAPSTDDRLPRRSLVKMID